MIFITIMAIVLIMHNYGRLAYLINPGFTSDYAIYFVREPFLSSNFLKGILEDNRIRVGLFGDAVTEVSGKTGRTDLTYSPFWVDMDRWLMAIFFIAIILLLVNRILIKLKKMPEYVADIAIYLVVILSIGGYYLAVMGLGDYKPQKADFHGTMIALVIYLIFAIIFGIFRKRAVDSKTRDFEEYKEKYILNKPEEEEKKDDYSSDNLMDYIVKDEPEEEEKAEKPKRRLTFAGILVIIQVLLLLVIPCKFLIDAIRISVPYKSNYGQINPSKMTVRTDLEESGFLGNAINQAVETEDGVYFIEYVYDLPDDEKRDYKFLTSKDLYIRKMDKEGNITDVYFRDSKDWRFGFKTIGYSDGYLYVSTSYYISRIDPKDGSEVEVISAPSHYYIADCCVVDNRIYYSEYPEDSEQPERKAKLWVAEINGTTLSEPELYASDINRGVFATYDTYYASPLLNYIVIGEEYDEFLGWESSRCMEYKGVEYSVSRGNAWTEGHDSTGLLYGDTSIDTRLDSIGKVSGYNIYNDSIYYVQLKENGFDVCKCNLDGTDVKVLDTYTSEYDLTYNYEADNYRVIIGQGKIYVTAIGAIYPEEDYENYWDMESDEIHFVTDLE